VALIVGGWADVQFDEPDGRVVEVFGDPVGLDEGLSGSMVRVHRLSPLERGRL
jgi:hypothetical protein